MAGIFVSSSRSYVIRGILAILTGGLLLFLPGLTLQTVLIVIGGMLLISGMINIALSNRKKVGGFSSYWSIQGLFNIAVGLIFMIAPATMVKIFAVLFGIILLIMGITQLMSAFATHSWSGWSWIFFILALLTLAGGILLLYNPFKTAEVVLIFIGAILLIYGISEIFMAGKVKHIKEFHRGVQIQDIQHEEI